MATADPEQSLSVAAQIARKQTFVTDRAVI
jgi:hypothetical protein